MLTAHYNKRNVYLHKVYAIRIAIHLFTDRLG